MNDNVKLNWLVDRAQITDVITTYAVATDARDWKRWGELMTDDVTIDLGVAGSFSGRDAVVKLVADGLADVDRTQHMITMLAIRIDGDTAHVRAILQTLHIVHQTGQADLSLLGRGAYEFDLIRTADGWRITRAANDVFSVVGDPHGRAAARPARRNA
jgi:ketosteroid isomerase-like protein